MTGWGGYAGWTGGVEVDTFGHQRWLRDNLPSLAAVVPAAQAAGPRVSEPPAARIASAIAQLRARGVPVGSRRDLLSWLVDGWERVQQGQPGFALAAPALAVRVFAAGAVERVPARQVAEAVADHLNNPQLRPPVATVTLPQLADALTVDRLDLFAADGIEDELRRPLGRLLAGHPELAERLGGNAHLGALAALVWREGLALQYAREAAGEVVFVAPAPYEGDSLFSGDLAELVRNGAVVQGDIGCLGFTHEIYPIEQKLVDDQLAGQARQRAVAAGLTEDDVRRAGAAARRGPVALAQPDDRTYTYREAVEAGRLPAPPVRRRVAPRRPTGRPIVVSETEIG